MKKTVSIILCVAFIISCFAVNGFTATKQTVKQYGSEGGYLAIGDSLFRGCGAEGFYINNDEYEGGQYDMYFLRNVVGAVPTQISQAVGCNAPDDMTDKSGNFWPLCYPGMTVAMVMDLLGIEDNFTDTALDYQYYDEMLRYFGYEGSFDGTREGEVYVEGECGKCGNIIEVIKKADLITVELGMCDVFYRVYRIASNGGSLAGGASFDLSSPESIVNLVSSAIKEINFGFDYWKEYYPYIIKKIQELNPDATIVMVGSFNLLNELTLTDETVIPLGSLFSGLTTKMNLQYEKWAKQFNVLYADVANTEVQATENDWSLLGDFKDNTFTATHPTQTGYDYMTRQILSVLPDKTAKEGISVDLGRYEKVDYVLVNGLPVSNYSMDGFTLTIPYPALIGANLTIGVKNDDSTTAARTYQLIYKADTGYSAYRIYGRNDIIGTLLRPFRLVIGLIKTLIEKIKGM